VAREGDPVAPGAEAVIDTSDGAKPQFLNRGKKRRSELALSLVERVNPEHTPGACPERSRRIRPGSRIF